MLDWGLHLNCKAKYNAPFGSGWSKGIGLVTGVSYIPFGEFIQIDGVTYQSDFCTPVVIPLEKVTDEDKLEFQKKFCPDYIVVKGFYMEDGFVNIQHTDTRSLSSIEKIYDDIFSKRVCDFIETRFLTKKGYNCGQFPEGSYVEEEKEC